jgi:hypothetical protein
VRSLALRYSPQSRDTEGNNTAVLVLTSVSRLTAAGLNCRTVLGIYEQDLRAGCRPDQAQTAKKGCLLGYTEPLAPRGSGVGDMVRVSVGVRSRELGQEPLVRVSAEVGSRQLWQEPLVRISAGVRSRQLWQEPVVRVPPRLGLVSCGRSPWFVCLRG